MSSQSQKSNKKKYSLKRSKALGVIWNQESGFVVKSSKERVVIGRHVDGELIPLNEEMLPEIEELGMTPDMSLLETGQAEEEEQEEEQEETEEGEEKEETEENGEEENEEKKEKEEVEEANEVKDSEEENTKEESETKKEEPASAKESFESLWEAFHEAILPLVNSPDTSEVDALKLEVENLKKELESARKKEKEATDKLKALKSLLS